MSSNQQHKLLGLLVRQEAWRLSWRAWVLLLCLSVILAFFAIFHVYSFLALEAPVTSEVLVIEGWIHHYAIQDAVAEFHRGKYRYLFVTGGPVAGSGSYTNDFNTYASVGGEELIAAGLARSLVQIVPSHEAGHDRTYSSALTLGRALAAKGLEVHSVNVMTENAHARRSLILFQQALGAKIKVGVIPIPDPDYDPQHWWRYSEGVRDVIGEMLAYLYVKLLFHPDKSDGERAAS